MTARIEESVESPTGRRFVVYERRSTQLSREQWAALDELTKRLAINARGGSRAGKPSWRTLLRMLATGELVVQRAAEAAGV